MGQEEGQEPQRRWWQSPIAIVVGAIGLIALAALPILATFKR